MSRRNFGKKDGSQKGLNEGGWGRNRTDKCRHPNKKNKNA